LATGKDPERFAAHALWRRLALEREPELLLKDRLESPSGDARPEALELVRSDARVVGVVVNALDDQLKGPRQMRVPADLEHIRPLRRLFEAALDGGRAVFLVADHGHVRTSRMQATGRSGDGKRYRFLGPGDALAAGEVAVSREYAWTPAGKTHAAMLACETEAFGGIASSGEHGGASLAEVVTPALLVGHESLRERRRLETGIDDPELETSALQRPRFWDLEVPKTTAKDVPMGDGARALHLVGSNRRRGRDPNVAAPEGVALRPGVGRPVEFVLRVGRRCNSPLPAPRCRCARRRRVEPACPCPSTRTDRCRPGLGVNRVTSSKGNRSTQKDPGSVNKSRGTHETTCLVPRIDLSTAKHVPSPVGSASQTSRGAPRPYPRPDRRPCSLGRIATRVPRTTRSSNCPIALMIMVALFSIGCYRNANIELHVVRDGTRIILNYDPSVEALTITGLAICREASAARPARWAGPPKPCPGVTAQPLAKHRVFFDAAFGQARDLTAGPESAPAVSVVDPRFGDNPSIVIAWEAMSDERGVVSVAGIVRGLSAIEGLCDQTAHVTLKEEDREEDRALAGEQAGVIDTPDQPSERSLAEPIELVGPLALSHASFDDIVDSYAGSALRLARLCYRNRVAACVRNGGSQTQIPCEASCSEGLQTSSCLSAMNRCAAGARRDVITRDLCADRYLECVSDAEDESSLAPGPSGVGDERERCVELCTPAPEQLCN
jgi:hypothetical protein